MSANRAETADRAWQSAGMRRSGCRPPYFRAIADI
jgi:hypothetical protein